MPVTPHVSLTNRWVALTSIVEADLPELRAAADDPRLWALTLRNGYGEAFESWFEAARTAGHGYTVRTAAGRVVGSTSLLDLNHTFRTVEIGNTWYTVESQGTAVNPASKRLLLGLCFETLGMNRVQFQVDARNSRSQAAVLKLGATREGLLRKHKITYTGWVRDTVMFSIVADEWPAVRARLDERLAQFGERPA